MNSGGREGQRENVNSGGREGQRENVNSGSREGQRENVNSGDFGAKNSKKCQESRQIHIFTFSPPVRGERDSHFHVFTSGAGRAGFTFSRPGEGAFGSLRSCCKQGVGP